MRILITGVGSGIGRAIARRMAGAGHEVTGTVRDPARAAALTEEARAAGLPLTTLPLRLEVPGEVERLAADVDRGGGPDALIHNAGFGVFGAVEEVDGDAARRQLEVNLLAPLDLTRRLLPGLRARRGRVLWVGSLGGRFALPFQAHYSASKAAVAAISDAMRLELQPFGVQVCCLELGDFATDFPDGRARRPAAGSPYREAEELCLAATEAAERGGLPPAVAARAVERLLHRRRLPARVHLGRFARTMCLLQRLLPDAAREWAVRRLYRL